MPRPRTSFPRLVQKADSPPYFDVARLLLPPPDWEFLRRTLDRQLPTEAAVFLTRLIERGYPIQYLIGREIFMDLELLVFPGVFIPREETERLVQIAAENIPPGSHVLDVGSGTGAIGVALKLLRPDLSVDFCDVSWAARFNTYVNVKRLIGDARVFYCDMTTHASGEYDVIISNPPYVPDSDETHPLTYWEPDRALFGGNDGTDMVGRAIRHWGRIQGIRTVFIEVTEGEIEAVVGLMNTAGFKKVDIFCDQFGVRRFAVAWR